MQQSRVARDGFIQVQYFVSHFSVYNSTENALKVNFQFTDSCSFLCRQHAVHRDGVTQRQRDQSVCL